MTFFLSEQKNVLARGEDIAPSSNAEGLGAGVTSYFRSIDSFNGIQARTEMEKVFVGKDAGERLGVDTLNQWYQENDAGYDHIRPAPTNVDDFIEMHGEKGSDIILDLARQEAARNPDAWEDLDISQDGIDTRVTEGLKASSAADAQLLALSPSPMRNALLGGLVAGVIDPINLATIPFVLGGGSILRTMGRFALLNGAIEGLQHPARARTAERLDQEAPSLIESVVIGMAFGAVLGGAMEGVPRLVRGLIYYREMKKVAPDPTISPVTQEVAIQSAERAIVSGGDPIKAVRQAILSEPAPSRRPLILDESMAVTPEPTALAPDPITTAPLEPVPGIPNTVDQIGAVAKSGIAKAEKKPTDLSTFVVRSGGIWKGDDRGEIAAMEYKRPGFIKTTKFAQSTAGHNKGGRTLDDMRQMAEEAGYLPPQSSINDLLDALGDDVKGNKRYATGEAGPTTRKTYDPDYVPERAYADPDPEARGLLINDLDARQFAEPDTWRDRLAEDFDAYLVRANKPLLPRERDEILQILSTRGGDAEDLVYSAYSRELDEADQALVKRIRGEAYGQQDSNVPWGEETGMGPVPDSPDGSPARTPETPAGNAPEPGARADGPAIERTDIGDQYVVPGTRRVDDYQKHVAKAQAEAKALQSAMRSSAPQSRVEAGEGGLFGSAPRDMFSEPADPKSKPAQISMIESLRDETIADDFMVDVGNGPVKSSTLLKEMDDDLDFEDILNACGKRTGAT